MELTVRIYKKDKDYSSTRTVSINESKFDEIISRYIKEEYLNDSEELEGVSCENITL